MQFGDDHSRNQAYELLRGLTFLQTVSGENRGNVVLWMQPDGTLNPSADPPELPDPSDSGASYWLARTIWALGEGYRAFRDADPDFRRVPAAATRACHRRRGSPGPHPQVRRDADGRRVAVALMADRRWRRRLLRGDIRPLRLSERRWQSRRTSCLAALGNGVALMQLGSVGRWPYRAIMPWAQSRSVWHAWGDQMSGALATAGATLGNPGGSRLRCGRSGASRLTCSSKVARRTAGYRRRPNAPKSPTAPMPPCRTWFAPARRAGEAASSTWPVSPPPGTSATTRRPSRCTTPKPAAPTTASTPMV